MMLCTLDHKTLLRTSLKDYAHAHPKTLIHKDFHKKFDHELIIDYFNELTSFKLTVFQVLRNGPVLVELRKRNAVMTATTCLCILLKTAPTS